MFTMCALYVGILINDFHKGEICRMLFTMSVIPIPTKNCGLQEVDCLYTEKSFLQLIWAQCSFKTDG